MEVVDALMWSDTFARLGEGDGNAEALVALAEEVRNLITLAAEAGDAWDNDRDAKVGKLLRAMTDRDFRKQYRPDMTPNDSFSGGRRPSVASDS